MRDTNNTYLMAGMLARGDVVALIGGKLSINPASGKPVPDDWLADNQNRLINEIVERIGVNAFRYKSYSTGRFMNLRASGVNLQFRCLLSDERAFCTFNAELKRARTTKNGNKGEPLLGKKFRVGEGTAFVKFWRSTGLEFPKSLSSFHDYMGNLGDLVFTGEYCEKEKLDKQTVRPLELSHEELLVAFSIGEADISHIVMPYKASLEAQAYQGIQGDPTASEINCGAVVEDGIISAAPPLFESKRPQDQSMEEWSNDLD